MPMNNLTYVSRGDKGHRGASHKYIKFVTRIDLTLTCIKCHGQKGKLKLKLF